ncbi:hypothetical protein SAMN05421858_3342 [Haladaptatus litoreus]|uniref:Uncharacterized protein n=1 Tax=Haladaptatus litoreus TaxID=553468 RepID=A0A1N7CY71_9EURY|nr:hypothetical protein SAMN05421858_3342 [Haladaptatus litoreus]
MRIVVHVNSSPSIGAVVLLFLGVNRRLFYAGGIPYVVAQRITRRCESSPLLFASETFTARFKLLFREVAAGVGKSQFFKRCITASPIASERAVEDVP